MKEFEKFWTGLADFIPAELPPNAIGVISRVVTVASSFEEFERKVRDIESKSDGKLLTIEESCRVSDFVSRKIDKNHEIFEMLATARKNPDDVVYGIYEYYTLNDS